MPREDLLSCFERKMRGSDSYLKIPDLKNGFSYVIWARNAFAGVWDEKKCGFVIARHKGTSKPTLFIEYHWDYDTRLGTAKPIAEIEKSPFRIDDSYHCEDELLKYLEKIEIENPILKGFDTVKIRMSSAIDFGKRLACNGKYADRLGKEPIWKRERENKETDG